MRLTQREKSGRGGLNPFGDIRQTRTVLGEGDVFDCHKGAE